MSDSEQARVLNTCEKIISTLRRRVHAQSSNLDEAVDAPRRRRLIALAVDEAVEGLLDLAASLDVEGRVDPRLAAKADLGALHEVHVDLGDLVRNIDIYLDGRATQGTIRQFAETTGR